MNNFVTNFKFLDKNFYINKYNVTWIIFTCYGEITFGQTLYRNKHKKKMYYYFVDDI